MEYTCTKCNILYTPLSAGTYPRCKKCSSWISYNSKDNLVLCFGIYFLHEDKEYDLVFDRNVLFINRQAIDTNISNNVFSPDSFEEEFNFILARYVKNVCLF